MQKNGARVQGNMRPVRTIDMVLRGTCSCRQTACIMCRPLIGKRIRRRAA